MNPTRRGFLTLLGGSAALLAAPAIMRVASIMPIRAIPPPDRVVGFFDYGRLHRLAEGESFVVDIERRCGSILASGSEWFEPTEHQKLLRPIGPFRYAVLYNDNGWRLEEKRPQ